MKRVAILTLIGTAAAAVHGQSFVDRARVQSVEPQYEFISVPRQECTSQWVTEPRPVANPGFSGGGYGGAIVGGIAGGIIGNQVGKGRGRQAATAAGAVIGAFAGDRIGNANAHGGVYAQAEYGQREVRSCHTVQDAERRLTGYRVTYEYRGQEYTTLTREDPGRTLAVQVSVTPLEERGYHHTQPETTWRELR